MASNPKIVKCDHCDNTTLWFANTIYPQGWHPVKLVNGKPVMCNICPSCWNKPNKEQDNG